MRLGILGPAQGNLPALARAAQRLLDDVQAEKVLYLAEDGALERVVASWARGIVGEDTEEQSIFERAARKCAQATSEEIDAFVALERARLRLKVLASLPVGQRTIEILGGRVALFVYDRDALSDLDMAGSAMVVFGKREEPVFQRVGTRVFMAPGVIGSKSGGALLLDDSGSGIRVEVVNSTGAITLRENIAGPGAKSRSSASET